MTMFQPTLVALSLEGIVYLLLALVVLWRAGLQERSGRTLILYLAVSGLWVLEQLAWRLGWLGGLRANAYVMVRVPTYGLLLLALLFLHLTRSFLRLPDGNGRLTTLGVAWIAGVVVLDTVILAFPGLPWLGALTFGIAVVGWGLLMGATAVPVVRAYRQAKLPPHRNRFTFWLLAWAITLAGDLLFLAGWEILGGDVRLLGNAVVAYVVITHRLPDVRQTLWRAASYLIMTLLSVFIYTAGFAAAQILFRHLPGYNPLWAGAAMALVLAVAFSPLLGLVQRLVNHIIGGAGYDPGQMVSEYSLRISNIVSLERLATVALELIGETLGVERGALYVVHHERDEDGAGLYQLRGIPRLGDDALPGGTLSDTSPLTHHLREVRQPLTQYDVDLLPEFEEIPAAERDWLWEAGMSVYVPIHARASWIGLLVLGAKSSGDCYLDQDLALLCTLADQTAVALENARLVDDLVEINYDLEKALATLGRTNRQLQELDRLKSAFIGAITHELRSPFANIGFSLELLIRDGLEKLTPEQREQLQLLIDNSDQARVMIDNLVTFATFLSKQGELNLDRLEFKEVLGEALLPLQPLAATRGLTLRVFVPDELPTLRGDRERLSDAVHHLVHNAIRFTPEGGEIWIRSRARDGDLFFEIKDTGIGVPAERLPTLWEDFTQMADPLQRGLEGLGLGLPLVKYIVAAHGGSVWSESREGIGSTFGFQVPLGGPNGRVRWTTGQEPAETGREPMRTDQNQPAMT